MYTNVTKSTTDHSDPPKGAKLSTESKTALNADTPKYIDKTDFL